MLTTKNLHKNKLPTCLPLPAPPKKKEKQALDFQNDFPSGVLVEAHGLSVAEMNGLRGRVLGPQEERLRVHFPEPSGVKAGSPYIMELD